MRGDISLTKGSRYRVMSRGAGQEPLVSIGEFRGYVNLGNDQAISLWLEGSEEEGRIRLIPVRVILAIDVIEGKEEEMEESDAVRAYFV